MLSRSPKGSGVLPRRSGVLQLAIAAGLILSLTSCATATDKITQLCGVAMPFATLAMPLPIVGPYIAAGVQIGCTTADGLARLRADANSAFWLAEQIGLLRAALGR